MTDNVVRVVLLPRYTAIYGTQPIYSAPINVKQFAKVLATVWMGTGIGSTPATATFAIEQSTDLDVWNQISSFAPAAANEEKTQECSFGLEWARLKVVVSGTAPYTGLTVWATGAFVLREGA